MATVLTSPPGVVPPSKTTRPGPAPELPRHPLPGLRKATDLAAQIDRDLARLGGLGSKARDELVDRMAVALTSLSFHLDQMVAHTHAGYPSTFAD